MVGWTELPTLWWGARERLRAQLKAGTVQPDCRWGIQTRSVWVQSLKLLLVSFFPKILFI